MLSNFVSSIENLDSNIFEKITDNIELDNSNDINTNIETKNLIILGTCKGLIKYYFHKGKDYSIVKDKIKNLLSEINEKEFFNIKEVYNELVQYMNKLYNDKTSTINKHIEKELMDTIQGKTLDKKTWKIMTSLLEKYIK